LHVKILVLTNGDATFDKTNALALVAPIHAEREP
jgi:hypothetical protein